MENNDLLKQIVGKNLKLRRTEMNLSQEGLTKESGVNDKHFGRIERGEKLPGFQTLYKLRTSMNISIDKLIDEVEKEMEHKETEDQ
ncbi:hypothetical protein CIL05_17430 [Virgibacillus profundi]|uniref:HTH cro/C1-type domain-containing protein n=1 Tax=Virgibacillus profundi TaxID=2024555 RepID=A0A2A2IB94_9BACI|nr:helix-turn-helix transcriptional regulator [Virgibacillus profundi]PAV28415.1 hypothetical protein CIL05_17430 [Virgibacillus profundi]PXY52223.1 XRE family transcriptional regulator [Virgibacillus profundi]